MAQAAIPIALMAGSQLFQGYAESKGLKAGAKADDENARLSILDGEMEAAAIRRRERAVSGEAIAALGANGVQIGAGSALDLLVQNSVDRELDIMNTRYKAASEARGYAEQAKQKRKQAKYAIIGGVLRAGAAALSAAKDAKNAKAAAKSGAAARAAQLPGGQAMPLPSGRRGG